MYNLAIGRERRRQCAAHQENAKQEDTNPGRFLFASGGNTIQTNMDLVREARAGSEAAFLRLFDEHHLPLFRFAYRLTGSTPDAEDVVQECFLELLRPGCSYDSRRTSIRTYLFGIVRNQCLKRWRKDA